MEQIYQHFRPEEHEFIDLAADWVRIVQREYRPYLTVFLNPRQQFIVESLSRSFVDLRIEKDGGYEAAERKRILIIPDYYEDAALDFNLALFEVEYPNKFHQLSHGQVLGSITGEGLDRRTIGDIINQDERWQVIVDKTIKEFVSLQIKKMGKIKVKLSEQPFDQMIEAQSKWDYDTEIVSSLRLDTFLGAVLNISRDKSKQLINQNKVKLNWVSTNKLNTEVETDDIISITGFGRVKFIKKVSRTKKNKYLIEIGKKLR